MDLATEVYAVVKRLPVTERFGLHQQLTRAAGSVPANIAEGYGLLTRPLFAKHLRIANGSLKEVETHLELAMRAGLLADTDVSPPLKTADRLGAVLRGLLGSVT